VTEVRRSGVKLSVVIAVRDAERTIVRAMMSVLCQSFQALELLVVDDGSHDASARLVASVDDPRVRTIRLPKTVGRGAARNIAIRSASGEFIAVLDADDVALPGRFAESLAMFDGDRDLVVVSGQARFVSPRGRWRLRRYPLGDEEIRHGLVSGDMTICHGASAVRRAALDAVGGYRPDLTRAQDFDLMRRLLREGRFANSASDFIDYHHSVLLPFSYWRETRRNVAHVMQERRAGPPSCGREVARYTASMARRVATFGLTREVHD
jgi:glycosyltransferase involved in cell wall biosynthesis